MDWVKWKSTLRPLLKKYCPVVLAVAAGLLLLSLPQGQSQKREPEVRPVQEERTLEQELERLLGTLAGAGKVAVLLTRSSGEETVYQMDRSTSGGDTVLLTGSERRQEGLIRRVDAPVYRGAVVLCQGADDAKVRLSVVQAVMAATGLSSERITVLKMK